MATMTETVNAEPRHRSRTTSLFSSVSSKLRFGSSSKTKSKTEEGGDSQGKSFLARRLSAGTSTRPPPPRGSGMPLGELNGAGMVSYRERMGTYSRSSPELNDEFAYQAWPTLAIQDEDEDEGDDASSAAVAIPFSASRAPRAARVTYDALSLPFTRTLSSSPPTSLTTPEEEEQHRNASRAEALAKLTETRPPAAFPFPSAEPPPRPSRLPPPPPLDIPQSKTRWSIEREWLVEDAALRRRRSVNADKRARHKSAGEAGHGARPLFRPIVQAPSPVSTPPNSSARWQSTVSSAESQGRPSIKSFESDDGLRKGLRRARALLEREVGVDGRVGEKDEIVITRTLRDGAALCRLVNALFPASEPISPAEIATSAGPRSAHANLSLFYEACTSLCDIPSTSIFSADDLASSSPSALCKICHTLLLLEHRAREEQRQSASSLSPPALPIDINLRGRVVRARSSNTTGSSSLHDHTHDSSGGSEYSPGSSRFTDSTYATTATRRSLDIPSAGPSVTFVERIKASDRDKDWGAPAGNVGSNRIYGDRRMAESAVDVLGVVEEDAGSRILQQQPKRAGLGRQSSSPSPTPRRQQQRFSSEAAPVLTLDTESSPKPRQRHSSDAVRPYRLAQRSVSSPIVKEPEPDADNPIRISRELSRRSTDSHRPWTPSSSTDHLPFPSSSDNLPSTPVSRPRPHKRWGSEVYLDRQPYLSAEQPSPARSRHESLHSPSPSSKSQRVMRTKLVLREDGRPTLTYQLGECIGRGQFGSVYRALNLNSGRVVAVKRISLEDKTEAEVQQLSNEVALLKSLVHPSVVKYEGLVRSEHYLNLILEYVENGSLEKTLKTFGELPEELVASYVVKILEGLDYLHSKNVVHCDLKAANLLSTKTGNIKLSDFGVSLNLNALRDGKTADHEVNGTPNWMAPEVIELKGASTKADIWSLGCTIIELIDGKPPYADLVSMSAMFRIVEDPCPPIPDRCSLALVDFLLQCFAKDPIDRPTANDLFAHEWLQSTFDASSHDLRPQDSIPFLSRLSSEMRRPTLAATFDAPSPLGFSHSPHDDENASDPFSTSSSAELRRPVMPLSRRSCDETESPKSSSFGPSVPTSPVLSPSSPTSFSLGDIFKSRRSKITPTTSDPSIGVQPTDSRPSNALRHLSDLISAKSRTPEPTPPSSLSKSHPRLPESSQELNATPSQRAGDVEENSNPLTRQLSLARPTDLGVSRKRSHRRAVSQPVNKPKASEDCLVQ